GLRLNRAIARLSLEYAKVIRFPDSAAERRFAFRSISDIPSCFAAASITCDPAGRCSAVVDCAGHGLPSTIAPSLAGQLISTSWGDVNVIRLRSFAYSVTTAEDDARSARSGFRMLFSKYSATRGKAVDARCTSSKSSVPVCCFVGYTSW